MHNNRVAYVDGLKAFSAIWVTLFHYIVAFVIDSGYIGWESGIDDAQKIDYFWANAPFSFLANATFPLYIFFAIIAFLPAWNFFNTNDIEWIKKQALVRYFRFVPYTLIITIISYIVFVNGGYFNQELGTLLNINWNTALIRGDFAFSDALISSLFRVFWQGDDNYVTVLWCMHIIFLGSYLSYALLLMFASLKKHMYIYLTLFVLGFFVLPWASVFVGGIMLASIAYRETQHPSSPQFRKFFGLLLFAIGMFFGFTESGLTTNYLWTDAFKIIAALAMLLSIFYLDFLQKILQNKWLLRCSKYVFSIIVVHAIIMLSVSSWMFIELNSLYGYAVALWATFFAAIFFNAIGVVLFAKMIDPICALLSKWFYKFLTQ